MQPHHNNFPLFPQVQVHKDKVPSQSYKNISFKTLGLSVLKLDSSQWQTTLHLSRAELRGHNSMGSKRQKGARG